jgi:diadenosine tetraphosphate (Ap4A) HIT family hydrolase
MPKEQITPGDLERVTETAAKYGLELTGKAEPYEDGHRKYGFCHPDHPLWVFTIDSDWRLRRRIRFQKHFMNTLRHNGILAELETGGEKNCSVREGDLERALQICTCPFCTLDPARVVTQTEHTLSVRDGYPVSPGHALVIPRLHAANLFDLRPELQTVLWDMVSLVRIKLAEEFHPDGFTIGVNDGIAAGQTIMHAHIHVIPRWNGDVPDPRGGVRWVLPDKAAYWRRP